MTQLNHYLELIGITRWVERDSQAPDVVQPILVVSSEITDAGAASELLFAMLAAIDLQPDDIKMISLSELGNQRALQQARLILCFGDLVAHALFSKPLEALRGQVQYLADSDIPVIATYHPSDLLANPRDKAKAYQDLLLAA